LKHRRSAYHLRYTQFIVPTVFIGYGAISLNNNRLKQLDISTLNEINEHRPYKTTLDNYTQYAPAFMVYALNAVGIKGSHGFRDRSIIYSTSQLISASFVLPLKHLIQEERPDGSNRLSFPSGHTATAFSSAHFMFREYREDNFWLGTSGYSFALFTGVYRTLNNKHWVSDVVAGAGFGILSTELSYWLYPKINGLLNHRAGTSNSMLFPSYQDGQLMLGMIRNF